MISSRKKHIYFFLVLGSLASSLLQTPSHAAPLARYIIQQTGSTHSILQQEFKAQGIKVLHEYGEVFDGLAVEMTASQLSKVSSLIGIEKITRDTQVNISAVQTPTPSWGLDRVDQRLPVNTDPSSHNSYNYNLTGSGSTVYVVDTGIYLHNDIASRVAQVGYNAITGDDPDDWEDCHGHGTHVAGTAAGSQYGVAKASTIVGIKVLNCNGSGWSSDIIDGLDWILSNTNPNSKTRAVVNMSLGGGYNQAFNDAVDAMVTAGVTVVLAAGNSNASACNASPASAPLAITVGATTSDDSKAYYSNYGSCVDIQAPGSSITSAYISSPTSTATWSGTSMAAPHVAGAVAVYLQKNPIATPSQVETYLFGKATLNVISGLPSETTGRFLYLDPSEGYVPPAPRQVRGPGRGGGAPTPTPTPTVTTSAASGITQTAATLNGGATQSLTSPKFCISTTNPGQSFNGDTCTSAAATGTNAGYSAAVSDLTASTTYYIQLTGTYNGTRYYGAVLNFTTLVPTPTLTTSAASAIAQTTVTLNGSATQSLTSPKFCISTTNPGQSFNGDTCTSVAAGGNNAAYTANVTSLTTSTTYYFQLTGTYDGTRYSGSVLSFSTLAPAVVTPPSRTPRAPGRSR
jgi:subtilisin family serine protease